MHRRASTGRDERTPAPTRRPARAAAAALLAVAVPALGCAVPAERMPAGPVVFAAASLRDALTEVGSRFRAATGYQPTHNFAGSNVLALQIEASRAADVFLSASEEWMNHLESAGLLVEGSRRPLLGNRLAVVAHVDSEWRLDALDGLAELDFRFLSVADPRAVPAGIYARELLRGTPTDGSDLWSRLEDRIAPAADVRAALAMVEARPDVIGIVYRTDARASSRVRVLASPPAPPGSAIRYSVAAIRGGSPPTAAYLEFLESEEAGAVFERHGFSWIPGDG